MESWFRYLSCFVIAIIVCLQIHQSVGFQVNEGDNVERGDNYIDKMLEEMLEQNLQEYDPYVIEDSSVGFSKKIVFVEVSGEAKLHNGYITGLSSLHRAYHCSVEEVGDKLLVKADLGAGVLDLYYDGTVKFMNIGPTISVHGKLDYLEIHMEFTVDAKTGRKGKLTKFVIDEMRGMQIEISGLGPLNWALNYLMKAVTSIFKGLLRKFMQNQVRNYIDKRIPNYQFPIEGGDIDITETPEITEHTDEITEEPEEITKEPEEITEEPEEITEEPEEITEEPEEITEEPEEITEEPEEITEEPEEITEEPEEITEEPEEITEDREEITDEPEEITEETEAPEDITDDVSEEEALEVLRMLRSLDLI